MAKPKTNVRLAANLSAFELLLSDRAKRWLCHSAACELLYWDFDISFPILLAPFGSSRVIHHEGEIGIARAAATAGAIHILPAISGHSIEDVRAASPSRCGISCIS